MGARQMYQHLYEESNDNWVKQTLLRRLCRSIPLNSATSFVACWVNTLRDSNVARLRGRTFRQRWWRYAFG